jgi:hypothetical protein
MSGGESQLFSTLAMHNELVKSRPELLEPLYRGYPTAIYEARHRKECGRRSGPPRGQGARSHRRQPG